MASQSSGEKAKRRADQAQLINYHQAKLADLLKHVREGFAEYDSGRIDAFELDAIMHHCTRAARKLWTFCAVSGSHMQTNVRTLEWWRERGEEPDWWQAVERPET